MRAERRKVFEPALQEPEFTTLKMYPAWTLRVAHPLLSRELNIEEKGRVREEITNLQAQFLDAIRSEDWKRCLLMLKPKYRVSYLLAIWGRCNHNTQCQLVRFVLTCGGHLKGQSELLYRIFRRLNETGSYRSLMMTPGEQKRLDTLADEVVVWRGSGDGNLGWAWTLDRFVARWLASEYAKLSGTKTGYVHKAVVPKHQILALLTEAPGGQETVILNPRSVTLLSTKPFGVTCRYRSPEVRLMKRTKSGMAEPAVQEPGHTHVEHVTDENERAVLEALNTWARKYKSDQDAPHFQEYLESLNLGSRQ